MAYHCNSSQHCHTNLQADRDIYLGVCVFVNVCVGYLKVSGAKVSSMHVIVT